MFFTEQTIKNAVRDMRGTADHMLKIWFVLKSMGLTKSSSVLIDTANSTPHLQRLFKSGNEDGSFFVPFAHTKRFAEMKSDASRSIIQTNIQRWASSGSVVTVDPTSFLSFDNSADGLVVRVGRQYPLGLGYNKTGFAREDGQRVNIPLLQFAIWYFAQTDLTTQNTDEIVNQLKIALNLDDSECELIFVNKEIKVEFQDTPITDKQLSEICNSAFSTPVTLEAKLETSTDYVKRVKNMVTVSEKPAWITISPEEQISDLISQGERTILLYGPPRTGKTRAIDKLFARNADNRCTIQLHEGWGYENLITGFMPDEKGNFAWKDGVLLHALREDKKVIVLEEVNRTRFSQALGEVFSLLEPAYRGKENAIKLPNGQSLSIPEDTVFIFTMNTIDASTEDVDDALIGRMVSVNFPPRIEDLNSILVSAGVDEENREKIKNVFNSIQSVYPLGHGYFANIKSTTVFTKYYLSRIRPILCNHFEAFKPEIIAQIDNVVDSLFITGK